MKYHLEMMDKATDTQISQTVEADSVFDAIDIVTATLEHPDETYIIKAVPIAI